MSYCTKCGKELGKDIRFCPKCGGAVGAEGKAELRTRGAMAKRQEACFGPPGSGGGLWGAISFGVFIIGLAILWIYDFFWPGILFLIALMIIIGALVSYARR
ncbi:MAG: zinc-ribbon domain-containing protein [Candidatus Bathyarchaeota archaeon]|nr:MAG: zinc-ribbon domain-containing protein [Candidatus Bathyarchaeota archaeon]